MGEDTPLVDLAPAEYRDQILAGDIEVLPGQNPEKPVVRWAVGEKKGQILPGSGRFPRANDAGAVSKATAYKRSASYQEAMNLLMPADRDETVKGSYAWWYNQAMQAAEGSPQTVRIVCPHEDCTDSQHTQSAVAFKKDGNLIFKLIELKHGKAKETVEVNTEARQIIELMEQREIVVHVYGLDSVEEESRKLAVSRLIDSSFIDNVPPEPVVEVEGSVPSLPPGS